MSYAKFFVLFLLTFLLSCGGKNTESTVNSPGQEKDTKSKTIDIGADILQNKSPLKKINAYLDGFTFTTAT
jgi:hypothetical protein